MLLPPSMQDKTEFMPLGKAIQKPEPVKADPVRDFEKHNHDIPGAKLPRVTPEMAARALRSLCMNGPKDTEPWETVVKPGEPVKLSGTFKTCVSLTNLVDGWLEPGDDIRIDFHAATEPLTWPTLPDLPEPTFLPEVVNDAPVERGVRIDPLCWSYPGR